jgi:hypothetical protein
MEERRRCAPRSTTQGRCPLPLREFGASGKEAMFGVGERLSKMGRQVRCFFSILFPSTFHPRHFLPFSKTKLRLSYSPSINYSLGTTTLLALAWPSLPFPSPSSTSTLRGSSESASLSRRRTTTPNLVLPHLSSSGRRTGRCPCRAPSLSRPLRSAL